ncbi:MAG: septum formation protein Maf, partial [Desulfovibrionaceae bacterium]|nr:septum formation protein Maf [Desulfovibrionaceae bacterium]
AALAKTLPVAKQHPEACVLGADTIVVLENSILGKPKDPGEALAMLKRLNGRAHRVITACAIAKPGTEAARQRLETIVDSTDVFFGQWPLSVLEAYAACGEPMDKAGAYAIQGTGGGLIKGIRGSWSTVVGLPLPLLLAHLLTHGVIAPRPH